MSRFLRVAAAAMAVLLPTVSFASDATTTRIETRPFYGATVTLEAGVRVFRPLPPHSKVIINPGGKTPLSLSFEESRSYSYEKGGNSASNGSARKDSSDDQSGSSNSSGSFDGGSAASGPSHVRSGYSGARRSNDGGPAVTRNRVAQPSHNYSNAAPVKH